MRYYNKPILSYIGLCLFTLTLVTNLCLRYIKTSDVGIGMLLSLANALLLVFTLIWSLMGVMELRLILRTKKKNQSKFADGVINKEEYLYKAKRLKFDLNINISYLVIIIIQLGYVVYNWDEVNI